ncbi:MAG: hypothetical protein ISN29_03670 [Gammaproteobacteria bacterium AqS3]|nr:hypothetical protein [Gammaproteobacteria bacterium AqS3]
MIDLNNQERKQEEKWGEEQTFYGYPHHRLWFRGKYAGYVAFNDRSLIVTKYFNKGAIENPDFPTGEEGINSKLRKMESEQYFGNGGLNCSYVGKIKKEFLVQFQDQYDQSRYEGIYKVELHSNDPERIEKVVLEENQWSERWLDRWDIRFFLSHPDIFQFAFKTKRKDNLDVNAILEHALKYGNNASAKIIIDSGVNIFSKRKIALGKTTQNLTYPEIATSAAVSVSVSFSVQPFSPPIQSAPLT